MPGELTPSERERLAPYLTNLDQPVFALRNLPEVVKGALFSRYSRTERSLRRVLLDEFLAEPIAGIGAPSLSPTESGAKELAEDFYGRVLVGYGDDSVAELAGAHLAAEQVSMLAAKALEDSRIGLSPLEKSTRYVRFDRRDSAGRYPYHRDQALTVPGYTEAMDALFDVYSELADPLVAAVRDRHPIEPGETERAWKAATKARALDMLRGLLPASTLTNVGLFGNGRAFEYLLIKLSASELPECRQLATAMHGELAAVIPAFVRRALDERHGAHAASRLAALRAQVEAQAPPRQYRSAPTQVTLVEHDPLAEQRVAAAALFPHGDRELGDLLAADLDVGAILAVMTGTRTNRRQKLPRALEHATYTFEITANFGAYRDLQRHRMLTQDRQLLGTWLGYDLPDELAVYGMSDRSRKALDDANAAHRRLVETVGVTLAQYAVPLAYRLRWYFRVNLREICHLCELRTTPQAHPDYRYLAQEMLRRVREVHPRLAGLADLADLAEGNGDLERRAAERRLDEKLQTS